jgi:organic radical activating enzyme
MLLLQEYPDIENILNKSPEGVIIFGGSRAGLYTLKALKKLEISCLCIIDNDSSKHASDYYGVEVTSPAAGRAKFGDVTILVSTMSFQELTTIKTSLNKIGFSRCHYIVPDVFDFYIKNFTRRKFDFKTYRAHKKKFYNRSAMDRDHSLSPSMTVMINEKCNLNCSDCAALVPLNQNPETFSVETIIKSLQSYCGAFDFVYRVCIMGGEPFLHKDIHVILESLRDLDNVLFIDIATNGTVVPQKKTMDLIDQLGATIEISDYGRVSRKMPELIAECEKRNIVHFIQKYESWMSIGDVYSRERDETEKMETFLKCTGSIGITNHIVGEKLSRCIFSAMAGKLKLIPQPSSDYVKLNNRSKDTMMKIRELTFRNTYLEACNYCLANDRQPVKPGLQIAKM